jgi:NAD(P)-dependent dehydrogenase (short-subunit alcohol dehydrogenase family)
MNATLPTVLITGAARRIGSVLAQAFGAAGWHVVIHHGFSHDEAEALASSLPSAEVVQCDLADGDAAEAMVEALAARLPDWRCLVNNASVFHEDSAAGIDAGVFDEAMAVNVAAPVRMAQAFLRSAQAKGGRRVIQFTDMKVANPNPDFFSYTLSKNAVAASVRTLAMAVQDPADRIYGLAPGAIMASHDQREEEHLASGSLNLLQRLTDPKELAEAALFLSQGWLASGETLFIDSGQHLMAQPRDVLYLARGLT